MANEEARARDVLGVILTAQKVFSEPMSSHGVFHFQCHRADGSLIWEAEAPNAIVDTGVQYLLNAISTAPPAIVGPFVGLMGGAGTVVNGDTMASHAGWTEVGGTNAPAYTGTRLTPTWAAASGRSKAISSVMTFTFTSGGTVVGAFVVMSTNAVNTKDSGLGTLYSAGTFAPQTVASTNVLTVTYSTGLT
jgi:hypothetical protein